MVFSSTSRVEPVFMLRWPIFLILLYVSIDKYNKFKYNHNNNNAIYSYDSKQLCVI